MRVTKKVEKTFKSELAIIICYRFIISLSVQVKVSNWSTNNVLLIFSKQINNFLKQYNDIQFQRRMNGNPFTRRRFGRTIRKSSWLYSIFQYDGNIDESFRFFEAWNASSSRLHCKAFCILHFTLFRLRNFQISLFVTLHTSYLIPHAPTICFSFLENLIYWIDRISHTP